MHIVLLNDDSLPTAHGGAAVVVERLRRAYTAAGHEVTLVTTHQDNEARHERTDDAGRIISLPICYDIKDRHTLCLHNPRASVMIGDTLRALKPDAVHAHNVHTYLTYESLTLAKQCTDSIVLTAHDTFLVSFGRVHENRKLTIMDHVTAVGRKYSVQRNRNIKKVLNKSEAKVVAISRALQTFLEKNGVPVHAMIHNGINVLPPPSAAATTEFRTRHGLEGRVIFYGGRISGDKGIDALLRAFELVRNELPDAQLAIAGDKQRITHYLKNFHGIVLLGYLPQHEMPLAFAAANVVTTPSVYLDPFNLINIEAMAAAKPVVGTTFGGTPEIVVSGLTGLLVDPRDTEQFSGALVAILRDPMRARTMAEAGQKRVIEHFSLQKQAAAYLDLLSS